MGPELYYCCKTQPSWIFVYENDEILGICDDHFTSGEHRHHVKTVINLKTSKSYSPGQIFVEILA